MNESDKRISRLYKFVINGYGGTLWLWNTPFKEKLCSE